MTLPAPVLVNCGALRLSLRRLGAGEPLVLLHGYPETGRAWTKVAGELARHFDVLIPDLRGYGQSDVPEDDPDHEAYSKRQMAADIVAMLDSLGIDRAHVLGHDRGGRVAYRMALDHPTRVARLGVIEILPTIEYWDRWTAEVARSAYHWTFLAQPAPLPERLIGGDPDFHLEWTLASWSGTHDLRMFDPETLAKYRAQMADPRRVAAMCADYRAGATSDRSHDAADRQAGHRIAAPTMLLHGDRGFPVKIGEPGAVWRDWCRNVRAASCESGHFVMEENPRAVIDTFVPFFS